LFVEEKNKLWLTKVGRFMRGNVVAIVAVKLVIDSVNYVL